MQLVGAGLRSARQDEPNHQKFSANSYAHTHLTVGGDAYIDPAECTILTEIFGEFVTSQRADVGIGPYNHVWTYIRIRRRFTKVQLLSVVRSTEPRPCRLRLL